MKVYEEFVIKGNTAVLRCHVPEYARDFVTVTAWLIDETVKISPGFRRGRWFLLLLASMDRVFLVEVVSTDTSGWNDHYKKSVIFIFKLVKQMFVWHYRLFLQYCGRQHTVVT